VSLSQGRVLTTDQHELEKMTTDIIGFYQNFPFKTMKVMGSGLNSPPINRAAQERVAYN
jgi:hypothetical protein